MGKPTATLDWLHRAPHASGLDRIEAYFAGFAFDPHRHDTYAIGCTIAGVQAFNYRGGHRQSLPGHTMVLHPDEAHDGQAGTDEGFHYRMIYVDPALIQEVLGGQRLPFVESGTTDNVRLLSSARALLEGPQEQHLDSVEETDAMVELALALNAASVGSGNSGMRRHADFASAKLARQFLLESWQSTVSMQKLSASTGRDRWSLSKDFRLFYGTSPSRVLALRRLDAARRQMLAGLALADVAASTGFADQAHMPRHFTQTFGISPARWLRAVRG